MFWSNLYLVLWFSFVMRIPKLFCFKLWTMLNYARISWALQYHKNPLYGKKIKNNNIYISVGSDEKEFLCTECIAKNLRHFCEIFFYLVYWCPYYRHMSIFTDILSILTDIFSNLFKIKKDKFLREKIQKGNFSAII